MRRFVVAAAERAVLLFVVAFVACAVVFQGCWPTAASAGRGRPAEVAAPPDTPPTGVVWALASDDHVSVFEPLEAAAPCARLDTDAASVALGIRLCFDDARWAEIRAQWPDTHPPRCGPLAVRGPAPTCP